MAIKLTKLSKREFFDKLKDYANFTGSISLMHSRHKIAVIEVKPAKSQGITPRYDITVRYVGNALKKIKAMSFKPEAGVEHITSVFGWGSLTGHQETIFDFRSIEIAEQIPEPVKEEVKPQLSNKPVVIKTTPRPDTRFTHFRYIIKGHPFWYLGQLYQRTNIDSHNALRLADGVLFCLDFDAKVLATAIEINVTGECP